MNTHESLTVTTAPSQKIGIVMLPLMLVLFISTLDQTIVATALGRIGQALGDQAAAPWIATAYLLTSAVTTLIFGKLGDIIGRKPVLQASIAIFVVGSLLCALAPTMLWLAIFRALQGLGGGGLSSLSMTVVGELVPARERARYQAVLGVVPALAVILGPLLGGLIVDHWDWPWIFLINLPIGVVAFLLIAARLHLPRHHDRRRTLDVGGSVLASFFTASFLLIVVEGGQGFAWQSAPILALSLVAVASLAAYVRVEHRAPEPITPLHLFKNRIFVISSLLFSLSTAALFVGMLFVPLLLQNVFGLTAFAAGSSIVPLLLGLIVATMVTGGVISRTGRYKIFPIVGAVLTSAGLYAFSRVDTGTSMCAMLIWLSMMGMGIGCFIQVTVLAGQNAVEHKDLGVATGALNFFKTLGGAAGSAVFGAVLAAAYAQLPGPGPEHAVHAFQQVFLWSMPLMGMALILAILLPEKPLSEEAMQIAEGKIEVPEY